MLRSERVAPLGRRMRLLRAVVLDLGASQRPDDICLHCPRPNALGAPDAGGNVSTPQFIALAERISGQDLGDFFDTWLFTPEKPAGIEPAGLRSRAKARAVYRRGARSRRR